MKTIIEKKNGEASDGQNRPQDRGCGKQTCVAIRNTFGDMKPQLQGTLKHLTLVSYSEGMLH